MDLSIVIPCYNESDGVATLKSQLEAVMPELRRRGSVELVMVDDGSTDDTFSRLTDAFAGWSDFKLARHDRNKGLGAALRTGILHANGTVVVVTDSDCTYSLSSIPALLDCLTPDVDIVTSSAYHPLGGVEGVPPSRVFFSRGASLIYRLLVDRRIYTWTAMYRAYRREVLERVRTESTGYLVMAELLVNAVFQGYRVAEYPAVLHVRGYGQSKARIQRIIRDHLRFQGGVVIRRLAAALRLGPPLRVRL
jgi:dolichol-phosphate mannosyltransferase